MRRLARCCSVCMVQSDAACTTIDVNSNSSGGAVEHVCDACVAHVTIRPRSPTTTSLGVYFYLPFLSVVLLLN